MGDIVGSVVGLVVGLVVGGTVGEVVGLVGGLVVGLVLGDVVGSLVVGDKVVDSTGLLVARLGSACGHVHASPPMVMLNGTCSTPWASAAASSSVTVSSPRKNATTNSLS